MAASKTEVERIYDRIDALEVDVGAIALISRVLMNDGESRASGYKARMLGGLDAALGELLEKKGHDPVIGRIRARFIEIIGEPIIGEPPDESDSPAED